ncbi:hypothetical protein [Pseudomonas putida]|uniref:hypothetical protein n=1 Tax=Pseudomonas putida TaxID=303 RepID=UPI0018D785C2|nr:hypothetical protein [Pseudomonas putida]MBH3411729.1 hypothetical protein [Pseudomonas putida]
MATSNTPHDNNSTTREERSPYTPPFILDLLLPDIDDGPINLLPFKATYDPLPVHFSKWTFSYPSEEDPERVSMYMAPVFDVAGGKTTEGTLVAFREWREPVKDDELFVEIPPKFLRDGVYRLYYKIKLFNGDETSSEDLLVTIDKIPPYLGRQPVLSYKPALPDAGLTDAYFQNNGNQLVGELPPLKDSEIPPGFEGETQPYLDAAVGDVVKWFWSKDPLGSEQVGSLVLNKTHLGKPLQLVFPAEFIRQAGNGPHFPRYDVQDYAGTYVQHSSSVAVTFAGTPTSPRMPPRVKAAPGNAYASNLALENASGGVTVEIPADAVVAGVKTTVFWGIPGAAYAYETDTPTTPDKPREYHIPKAFIAPHMGTTVQVHYQVGVVGEEPSQNHFTSLSWLTRLPPLQSDALQNGMIILDRLTGPAIFTLGTWAYMAPSQYYSAWMEGWDRNDPSKPLTHTIAHERAVPGETGPITLGSMSKAELLKFAHQSYFRIHVQVSFDNKQRWLNFPFADGMLLDYAS